MLQNQEILKNCISCSQSYGEEQKTIQKDHSQQKHPSS